MSSDTRRIKLTLSEEECGKDNNTGHYQHAPLAIGCQKMIEDDDDPCVQAMIKVFGNDLLREKIFAHLVNNSDTTRKDICSPRLVCKLWLWDINKLLFKSNKPPFIQIELGQQKSLYESDDGCVDWETSPPICLTIPRDCFRAFESVCIFFQSDPCLPGLVNLEIFVPPKMGSMSLIFPENLCFPVLKELTINFCREDITTNQDEKDAIKCYVSFLKLILSRTNVLKELALNGSDMILPGIERITYPSSLKKLYLNCNLENNQLKMFKESLTCDVIYW